ncbi:hypothetical protein HMI54_007881 [Coelomomyces lativittatus]|nr:hypothetical protein HMI56_003473 [Coelomomyces lativittatus]KAJ1502017.1 hypothetical protein HMI55_003098 [Coelomomyces lativittatus]KAJ1503657.1 hypothetical protein HMI54_007881 [Coelomomyces lativittatus]
MNTTTTASTFPNAETSSSSIRTVPLLFLMFATSTVGFLNQFRTRQTTLYTYEPLHLLPFKALGIATGLSFSVIGTGIFGIAYGMGIHDLTQLHHKLLYWSRTTLLKTQESDVQLFSWMKVNEKEEVDTQWNETHNHSKT